MFDPEKEALDLKERTGADAVFILHIEGNEGTYGTAGIDTLLPQMHRLLLKAAADMKRQIKEMEGSN